MHELVAQVKLGCVGVVPDEGGLRLALGVAKVEDQGQVAVVDGDTGDIDDARDALLVCVSSGERAFGGAWRALDSSDSWNIVCVCVCVWVGVGVGGGDVRRSDGGARGTEGVGSVMGGWGCCR